MKHFVASTLALGLISQSLLAQDLSAFKVKQDKEAAARSKAVMKVMHDCKVHTKDSDVNARGITQEVISGMGASCLADGSPAKPAGNLEAFMKDVKKVVRTTNQDKVWIDAINIALEKSVEGLLSLHMRVANKTGKITSDEALKVVCSQVIALCESKRPESQIIKKSVQAFLDKQKSHPIKFLDAPTQEKYKNSFNKIVDLANETCKLTHKEYLKSQQKYSCLNLPDLTKKPTHAAPKRPMTQSLCQQIQEGRVRENAVNEAKFKQIINVDLQLLVSSELGPLFGTKSFREKVGTLKPETVRKSCMENWKDKDHKVFGHVWHADIMHARTELYKLATDELKTIQKKKLTPPEYVDIKDELEQYLKTNPLTISELLKRSNDPQYAKSMCYYIRDIHKWDKISNNVDTGLMVVGAASTIALGFATAGIGIAAIGPMGIALAGVSFASNASLVTKDGLQLYNEFKQDDLTRQAIITKQRDLNQGLFALDKSDEKKSELKKNIIAGSVGLVVEGVGVFATVKKATNLINNLQKSPALYRIVDGASDSAKAVTLQKGADRFTKAVRHLGDLPTGLLEKISDLDQTKLAALFSKLSDVEANALVGRLAKLDADGLKKFFSMLDDVSTAHLDQKNMLAAIEDFTKTGGTKRNVPKYTPGELANLGPSVPKDASKVAAVYPRSAEAIDEIMPESTPEEMQKLLLDIRNKYQGKITDDEVGMLIKNFGAGEQGAKTNAQMLAKFEDLKSLKTKHYDLFGPNGVMNSPGLKDENELSKLHYLKELEENGIPLRHQNGKLMVTKDGRSVSRKSVKNMTAAERHSAIQKEFETVSRNPCSLD